MASSSSPSSSASSSYTPSFPFSTSALPVTPLRSKIVEKIMENRVTLIVGDTGCGKSSQVPQFLLEENLKPILCTQPRRFAVVAVAKTVAKARNCELGAEVGYHIGHSKNLSVRSNIVFKTAGVVLEEMRDKGLNALNYKVIILDEVHERSVESDLVLVCVKQFLMKNNDLRVVLMSATADIARYRDYFKDLGRGERVEVLAIPSTNQKIIFERKVFYLEQITEILRPSPQLLSLLSLRYCSGPTPSMATADIKPEVHKLIHDLVLHIHENEPDIEKSILVFLPTYYSLEQQWHLLQPLSSSFKVHILHSSVDTEQALMAMRIWKSHRKVILATNIAESSVTIPKVAFVIDSCRSLQVFWDNKRKRESANLVWVSKSQAEQRRGRTGRTCDGQIYRLVTRSFFSNLEDYECPSVLRLSLRQQVLQTCCAESKAINDPKVLLHRALDPPDPEVVEDALDLLVRMQALERTSRGRYEPTFYGRLLASFPLSFDASVLILKFGNIGMMHEGILLGILMDTQPLPILRPFGDDQLWTEYSGHYFSGDNDNTGLNGRKEILYMANLCAFQFWQRVFKDKHRVEHLKQLLKSDEMKATMSLLPKIEEEWCSLHNLVQSSLNHVSEIYEDILNSIHRFRPKFLGTSDGLPSYYDPYEFEHTCLLMCQQSGDTDALTMDDAQLDDSHEAKKCFAVPFVASNNFQNIAVAKNFASVVKEIKVECAEDVAGNQHIDYGSLVNHEAPLCVYFVNGSCNRGSECMFSHSLQSTRPACKFFLSLQGCRNGESCFFSHDGGPHPSASSFNSTLCLQEEGDAKIASLLQLFPTSSYGHILLLDDTDLHFTSNFAHHFDPAKIISTTCLSETSIFDSSLEDVNILWGLYNPYQAIISKLGANLIPWNSIKCVLWFPNFESYGENLNRQRILLQSFFEYMAIRILADALNGVQVILTMNNLRFSQLEVEKLGRESFFFLTKSFPFDERSFGQLPDKVANKKPMVVSRPFSYVFNLHSPTEIQFGDYAAVLRQHMGNMHEIGVDNLTANMAVCKI